MDLTTLGVIIVIIIVAWFMIRQLISAISCGVRALLFVIIAVAVFYVVGSALGWPIIDMVNSLMQ